MLVNIHYADGTIEQRDWNKIPAFGSKCIIYEQPINLNSMNYSYFTIVEKSCEGKDIWVEKC